MATDATSCEGRRLSFDNELLLARARPPHAALHKKKDVAYPLGPYPAIREFASTVERVAVGSPWSGTKFLGYTLQDPPSFHFRSKDNGIDFGFSAKEWQFLRELFSNALALPALAPLLEAYEWEYGEV